MDVPWGHYAQCSKSDSLLVVELGSSSLIDLWSCILYAAFLKALHLCQWEISWAISSRVGHSASSLSPVSAELPGGSPFKMQSIVLHYPAWDSPVAPITLRLIPCLLPQTYRSLPVFSHSFPLTLLLIHQPQTSDLLAVICIFPYLRPFALALSSAWNAFPSDLHLAGSFLQFSAQKASSQGGLPMTPFCCLQISLTIALV